MGLLDGILDFGKSIAGPLIGGIFGYEGQQSANDANVQIAQQNSAFNAVEAQKQRDWASYQAEVNRTFQHDMARTVWQHAVDDMKLAGLNPMLAYQQGGNPAPSGSNPSGAAATAVQPAAVLNKVSAGLNAAAQIASIQNVDAQTEKTRQETKTEAQKTGLAEKQFQVVDAELAILKEKKFLTEAEFQRVVALAYNALDEGERIRADTGNIKVDTALKQLQKAQARAYSDFYESGPGRAKPYVEFGTDSIGQLVGSAAEAKRAFDPVRRVTPGRFRFRR